MNTTDSLLKLRDFENQSLLGLLSEAVGKYQNYPVMTLLNSNESFTYGDLHRLTRSVVTLLSARGISPGDHVVFFTKNSFLFFPLLFACAAKGAILVPLDPEWSSSDIRTVLKDSEAKLVLLDGIHEPNLAASPIPTARLSDLLKVKDEFSSATAVPSSNEGPDQPVITIYTSGTTSHSKGVVLTQRNLVRMACSIASFYDYRPNDRFLSLLPYFHINAPMLTGLACMASGSHIHVGDLFGVSNAQLTCKIVETHRITILSLTPSIIATLLALLPEGPDGDLSSVRFALVGTARFDAALWRQFEAKFRFPCYQGYGLTETTAWATMTPTHGGKRYESVGVPVDCEIKIDPSAVNSGEKGQTVGEILIKGPIVMAGYHNKAKLTRAVLKDGWFHTGDLGYLESDGQLVISGRIKNVIKRSGTLILPEEIDEVLAKHPEVLEAKTIGLPDPMSGERVVSVISWKDPARGQVSAVRKYLQEEMSAYKQPNQLLSMARLPKNAVGKIDQKALLALLNGEMCEEIVNTFDRYEYRRAHSDSMGDIRELIQAALLNDTQVRFVGHWGVGQRTSANDVDRMSMDRLRNLTISINRLCRKDIAQMELILADLHGRCNSVPTATMDSYFAAITEEASLRGFRHYRLSDIWNSAGLNYEDVAREVGSPAFLERWSRFDLREDFISQAGKRPYNFGDPEEAAKRYYALCFREREQIARFFKGAIFFTFSSPKHSVILPPLPTLYWHSIKPGVAAKPWFKE